MNELPVGETELRSMSFHEMPGTGSLFCQASDPEKPQVSGFECDCCGVVGNEQNGPR